MIWAMRCDTELVQRPERERLQDQEVERALQALRLSLAPIECLYANGLRIDVDRSVSG